jgi:hypothetical protein
MRNSSLALCVVATLLTAAPQQATATTYSRPFTTAVSLLRALFTVVTQGPGEESVVQSQTVQAAGPQGLSVNLGSLDDLDTIESVLFQASMQAGPDLRLTVVGGQAHLGAFSVGSNESLNGDYLVIKGTAEVYGRLDGNLVAVDGDIILHQGALISGSVLAYNGQVHDLGGEVTGEIRTYGSLAPPLDFAPPAAKQLTPVAATLQKAAGLAGVFLSLSLLGFGLVLFARLNLEVVSDTISHSFGRSFVVGLIGQVLMLPTFGMIVVGLILSVAGILLLPFAVIVYGLLVILAVVGGILAVAHAMGETYTRRRMAAGELVGSPNSYRYLLLGLLGMFALWGGWVIFGWVPVAGDIIRGIALLITWLLGTAGFGAALLSRGGMREGFAGRILPPEAMTDEYLWATPQFGVPAANRPPPTRPAPPPV